VEKVSKRLLVLSLIVLTGCSGLFHSRRSEIYPKSYDKTYLTVLGALDDMKHWDLQTTDEGNGLIVIKSAGYWRGEKEVRFIVKSIGPYQTKVQLYNKRNSPFTQQFFKTMDERVREQALVHPS
jgi:hypothetical protein